MGNRGYVCGGGRGRRDTRFRCPTITGKRTAAPLPCSRLHLCTTFVSMEAKACPVVGLCEAERGRALISASGRPQHSESGAAGSPHIGVGRSPAVPKTKGRSPLLFPSPLFGSVRPVANVPFPPHSSRGNLLLKWGDGSPPTRWSLGEGVPSPARAEPCRLRRSRRSGAVPVISTGDGRGPL